VTASGSAKIAVLGELGLEGAIRPVRGALPWRSPHAPPASKR